jgi:hypothetical protein
VVNVRRMSKSSVPCRISAFEFGIVFNRYSRGD